MLDAKRPHRMLTKELGELSGIKVIAVIELESEFRHSERLWRPARVDHTGLGCHGGTKI